VISHPDDLVSVLSDPAFNFERIGLGAAVSMAVQGAGEGRICGTQFDHPFHQREGPSTRFSKPLHDAELSASYVVMRPQLERLTFGFRLEHGGAHLQLVTKDN
jgi:hypothetical protein